MELRIGHVVRRRLGRDAVSLATKRTHSGMALKADREENRPAEQTCVSRSVRRVTGFASVDAHSRVFVKEGSAVLGVAFQAWLLICRRLLHHSRPRAHAPRRGDGTVRIVAIRALHHALVDAMFERHVELRSNRGVAVIAEIRLGLREQKLRGSRAMNRVTTGTGNIVKRVLGTADLCSSEIARVARKTVVDNLDRLQFRESDDGGLTTSCLDMRPPRAVTPLASGTLGGFLSTGNTFVVRVLIEVSPDDRMTGLTNRAADKIGMLRILGSRERPGLSQSRSADDDSEDQCTAMWLHPHTIAEVVV